jgi:1,4-alpha-glucan branching enzyme
MPVSLNYIDQDTPMGANLLNGGATFRVWAPNALAVYLNGDFNSAAQDETTLLNQIGNGHWAGFVPVVTDRQEYMFYVTGLGSFGPKRDPWARELSEPFPGKCIIRDTAFPWHETGYQTPAFRDFVIYQLHVGVFYVPRYPVMGTFLDVVSKVPYLSSMGITILQLLPIQEFVTEFSLGYNNQDFFSPEMEFGVADADLPPYLAAVNALLAAKEQKLYQLADLKGAMNQLKALVDLCHIYGLGVIFDLVYNHAGGGFDDGSLFFMDRQVTGDNANSLYFTDNSFADGQVFDFAKPEVCDFLINNTKFFLDEYRVEGFRFDEVSGIDHAGSPDGWPFCQNMTSTLKAFYPSKINHAEYWPFQHLTVQDPPTGIGFSTTLSNTLRLSLENVISGASWPGNGPLGMDDLAQSLWPAGFEQEWQCVQGPENHDVVYIDHDDKVPRIPALSDPTNSRSWYATSRSRVSTGITMTSPGIPMLFMGQEFLEDKYWSDNYQKYPNQFIYWDGLNNQKQMADFLHYTSDAIKLRWQFPALRSQGFSIIRTNNQDRVIAYQRWVPGVGNNLVIVVSLNNSNQYGYRIGFPLGGPWKEVFNSDFYENCPNPSTCGNNGQVWAEQQPWDGLNYSAAVTLPANGVLVFAV